LFKKEFEKVEGIAGILFEKRKIRTYSVGSLARALTFVNVNELIQIESKLNPSPRNRLNVRRLLRKEL
jgi:hypothetical protein